VRGGTLSTAALMRQSGGGTGVGIGRRSRAYPSRATSSPPNRIAPTRDSVTRTERSDTHRRGWTGILRTNSVPGSLRNTSSSPCSCCENASTSRIPSRRPDLISKDEGSPIPWSLTDITNQPFGQRDNVTHTRQFPPP